MDHVRLTTGGRSKRAGAGGGAAYTVGSKTSVSHGSGAIGCATSIAVDKHLNDIE